MDVVLAVQTYTTKMVSNPSAMKVLLLDSHTTPIISLASTQSDLLTHQVYLTDRIDNQKRDRMPHLKCVCFLSPSEDSLEAVRTELSQPRYGEYYLYFSNTLTKSAIERLAEADTYEVVREVQEFFADYAPLLPSLFSLNYFPSTKAPLYGAQKNIWNLEALDRSVQGIAAVLLSLKKKPLIRYEKMSGLAKKLGSEIVKFMDSNAALFDFRPTQVPPLLLILDRLNDPVTPLLSQWSYQAMVHELLCIQNGRVSLANVPGITPDLREIILLMQNDPFFRTHLNSNFGDLGISLKSYVDDYQKKFSTTTSIESIADMKRFVEEYPEFRKLGGNVSKHVALVGELSRIVGRDRLLEVSEVEQSLACGNGGHAGDYKDIQNLIAAPDVPPANKLRLAMLYALRYQRQSNNAIHSFVESLVRNQVSEAEAKLIYVLLNIAGADQRQGDLFSSENIFSRGRSVLKGLKGTENVYTQHVPLLSQTLESLLKGRLREQLYPFIETSSTSSTPAPNATSSATQRPQDVIVFMVGGTTYEEARVVTLLNEELASNPQTQGTRILLGGTCVHNSSSFIEQIQSGPLTSPHVPTVILPTSSTSTSAPSSSLPPNPSPSTTPSLNLQLGGINVSVGGPGGTGIYRSRNSGEGISVQTEGLDGIGDSVRDGVRNLIGKVKQGVERVGGGLQ